MPPAAKKAKTAAGSTPTKVAAPAAHERNPIAPLDLAWVKSARVNTNAANRRAAELGTRRTVKKDWQAAWLLRAVTSARLPPRARPRARPRAACTRRSPLAPGAQTLT
jgi:hypothetical protein